MFTNSHSSAPNSMLLKSPARWLALPIVAGLMTISGCSTLGIDPPPPQKLSVASICPHPAAFASYKTFTSQTEVRAGESAFQTVKRFRLAEKEKNDAGKRLWRGMKQCRAKGVHGEEDEGFLSSLGL